MLRWLQPLRFGLPKVGAEWLFNAAFDGN